jgi:hypothetical protein
VTFDRASVLALLRQRRDVWSRLAATYDGRGQATEAALCRAGCQALDEALVSVGVGLEPAEAVAEVAVDLPRPATVAELVALIDADGALPPGSYRVRVERIS